MSTIARKAVAGTAAALIAGAAGYVLAPPAADASSHREAPAIAADPAVDNTDLYAFTSPDRPGFVTFVLNVMPFEAPDGGPNFFPFATDATYNIKVDNDGDARPDVVFRWTFRTDDRRGDRTFLYNDGPVTALDDENLLVRQSYRLEASFGGAPFETAVPSAPVAPSRVGDASMPEYQKLRDAATITLDGGWRIFAGQADDPFFLDLRVFDLLYGGDLSETGTDSLSGFNVNTIALEVPYKDVALGHDATRNPVVGVWSTTERPRVRITGEHRGVTGDTVQVSRLGNPLINEVIVPAGLKDGFNASTPDRDADNATLVARVNEPEVPKLIEQIYGIPAPATPRADLAEIFLTGLTTKAGGPIKADLNSQLANADADPDAFRPSEQLRLNLTTPVTADPSRLGVLGGDQQGFPNGRRLTDDVVDISLQALAGAAQTGKLVDALGTGDQVDANDQGFAGTFPYVALPNTTWVRAAAAPAADQQGTGMVPQLAARSGPLGQTMLTTVAAGLAGAAGVALVVFALLWRRRQVRVAAVPAGSPPVPFTPGRVVGTARVADDPTLLPPSDPFATKGE
ncbi:DUF4331 domain-containing protein [Catenuloplanes atrovinosus]|uniref:DUF4331 domain-containing protein n=1 Tax=Catenuloplanes atrovinosus TaxID=137266 RepID=A0AAE3YP57_9ACTN|nr:DUF4331 domain-containing protein [Catenuloplanes atrovinosus]MDR7276085.1 hypothetical protein [Catenuloplanes atrovinosus]